MRIVFRDRTIEPSLDEWLAGRYDLQLVRDAPMAAADTIAERSPTLSTTFLGFNVGHAADGRRARAPGARARHRQRGSGGGVARRRPGRRPAAEPIPPVMPGHSDNAGLPYDLDMARALLAEAGFPGGEGLPELVVDARPWSPAAALAEQLAAIGVRARFESHSKHFGVAQETHAWFAGWHADYPDPDGFYLGLLELGLPLYRDDETDEVLARARVSRDRDERLRLYREFERTGSAGAQRSCPSPTRASSCCDAPTCRA